MELTAKTTVNRTDLPKWVILFVYGILTLICALRHELWFDEAQAWLIVRDNDIAGVFRQLGYEGHPPLWYLILYPFAHLGADCGIINIISWFITLLAAAVIMFRSPFGIVMNTALLASGGFLYFNSVNSRPYCVIYLIGALLACLYPKRKDHPLLYGLLIALLANTHICVSGFIGILGIFMIIDLFKGWKGNTAKERVMELAGLAAAGIGVLTLVLPLLDSMNKNIAVSENSITVDSAINNTLNSFQDTGLYLLGFGSRNIVMYLLSGIIGAALVAEILLMRRKTRPLLMMIFFWVFFTITTEIVWFNNQSRANIFVYIFFIIAWIAEYEPENGAGKFWDKLTGKTNTKLMEKLLSFLKRADENYAGVCGIILTALFALSAPAGVYYLFSDISKEASPIKEVMGYIEENCPKDSVFVTDKEYAAFLAALTEDYRFYSTEFGEYYTYCTHCPCGDEAPTDQIRADLEAEENVYYMIFSPDIDYPSSGDRIVLFTARNGIDYAMYYRFVEISEFDLERELNHVESYYESLKEAKEK